MSRYIDKEILLNRIVSLEQLARKRVSDTPTNSPCYERYVAQTQDRQQMISIIKAMPTADVVEVVRCKDCEYWKADDIGRRYCELIDCWTGDSDFCSRGERREQ